jgi:ankyrin repeat protein
VSDKTQLRTQIWAHIDMDKASKRFGITCTTYLSFDDFKKRQLVKQSGLQDIDMTRPIWQASIGSAMPRLAKLINKMHTTSPSSSGVSRGIAQTLNEAIEPEFSTTHKIQRDHPFLQYATEFWEFHSRDFEPIDRIWPLWIALSSSTDSLIRQPWPILDGTRQSQLAFQKYIVQEKHFALLVWCQSGPNPLPKNQMKEILDEAFFTGATAFVTKFLRFLFDLALDVSMLGELLRGIILSDDAPAASRIMSLRSSSIGVLFEWDEIRAEVGPFHAKAYPTLLAVAAAAGEVKYVEELLAAQETINKKPDDGPARCRALEVAARAGHMKMIELMMAVPAEIDPKIAFDALKAMISSGHASDVARLLTKRSTAKAVDGGLPALLQMAARDGYVDMVAMLISAGVNVNDVYTRSALEVAAQGGHAEVVDQLFSAGATADTTTGGLPALLQMAAADGCADIVATLISIGVDVNEVFKCTALEVAVQGGHAQVVDHLLSAGATAYTITGGLGKLVWDAAYSGSARIIPKLVSQGAKVDEIVNGMTALEVAARNGHADVTKELLVAGANYDKTALLEAAVRNGHANVTRELLLAGASCDNAGLLKGAVRDGHANVTMELLLAGASCDKAALLEDAVGNGYANVTKVLLAAGATIRAQEVHRPSNWLLSRAASKGNVGIIGMLLEAGAHAGHLDDPKNAAVIASKNKHEEAGRILFQAVEANGRIKDCKTCTRKSRMGGRLVHDT